MYENGQDSMAASVTLYLTAALSGGMSEMLNQMEFSADVMSYDRQRLQDFQESKAALEEQYAQLSDEKEALDLMKQETEKKKQQVASQQKAAGSKLSSYNDMIAQKEGEISDMNELVKEKTQPVSYTHLDVYKRQPFIRWYIRLRSRVLLRNHKKPT